MVRRRKAQVERTVIWMKDRLSHQLQGPLVMMQLIVELMGRPAHVITTR